MRRAALAAALALLALPAPGVAAPRPALGVVANALAFDDPAPELRRARALGAGWVREELHWRDLEPLRRGGAWRWASIDRVVAVAARHGLRVLPLLTGSSRRSGRHRHALPEAAPFARFTARVVRRYGPAGTFWAARPELDRRLAPRTFEVWNEPFLRRFSHGGRDPARYARVFRAAAAAGRRAHPRARFLLAAEPYVVSSAGRRVPWIEPMAAAVPDLAAWVGGIAVHPYTLGPPSATTPGTGARFDFGRIGDVVDRFAAVGVRAPVWLTELGWSTCADRSRCVTRAQQASRWRDALRVIAAHPEWRVEAVFAFRLRDGGGEGPEDRYGLLDARGRPKPAWGVLRRPS